MELEDGMIYSDVCLCRAEHGAVSCKSLHSLMVCCTRMQKSQSKIARSVFVGLWVPNHATCQLTAQYNTTCSNARGCIHLEPTLPTAVGRLVEPLRGCLSSSNSVPRVHCSMCVINCCKQQMWLASGMYGLSVIACVIKLQYAVHDQLD